MDRAAVVAGFQGLLSQIDISGVFVLPCKIGLRLRAFPLTFGFAAKLNGGFFGDTSFIFGMGSANSLPHTYRGSHQQGADDSADGCNRAPSTTDQLLDPIEAAGWTRQHGFVCQVV